MQCPVSLLPGWYKGHLLWGLHAAERESESALWRSLLGERWFHSGGFHLHDRMIFLNFHLLIGGGVRISTCDFWETLVFGHCRRNIFATFCGSLGTFSSSPPHHSLSRDCLAVNPGLLWTKGDTHSPPGTLSRETVTITLPLLPVYFNDEDGQQTLIHYFWSQVQDSKPST